MTSRQSRMWWTAAALTALWIWGPGAGEAQAYLDPGTGGALFSSLAIVLGVASTGILFCFQQVKRMTFWLMGKFNHEASPSDLSERSDKHDPTRRSR